MDRRKILAQIDLKLQICKGCEKYREHCRIYGKTFSRVDGYCNKQCPTGLELQQLGRQLHTGREIKVPAWMEPDRDQEMELEDTSLSVQTGRRGDC